MTAPLLAGRLLGLGLPLRRQVFLDPLPASVGDFTLRGRSPSLLLSLAFGTLRSRHATALFPGLGAPRRDGSLAAHRCKTLGATLACALLGRRRLGFFTRRLPSPRFGALCLALLLGVAFSLLREPLAAAPFRTLLLAALPARLGRVHRRSSRATAVVAASVALRASRSLAEASGFVTTAFTSQTRERVAVRYG